MTSDYFNKLMNDYGDEPNANVGSRHIRGQFGLEGGAMLAGILYRTQHGLCLLTMLTPGGDARASSGQPAEVHFELDALKIVIVEKKTSGIVTPKGNGIYVPGA